MRLLLVTLVLVHTVQVVVGPPVTANKQSESDKKEEEHSKGADWDIGLEYNRYLQEVVQALESDPKFREKLEKAEVADIRTGKIASELEFVNHNVRSKLDELKRQEMERLRHLAIKEYEIKQAQLVEHENDDEGDDENEIDHDSKKLPYHLDHHNPHSFEIEDLRKLIVQTTKDLEEADRQRREEFKEYEMQKEYEKNQQLNLLDENHKEEYEHKIEEQEKKHKSHPSLHHPGSKLQLEEVWEEQDHMNPEDFNPKTFFHMHDLDGNGYWDADEVKALFQKELDKMYDPNAPEDDMRERREEMERMREHVYSESDVNKDHLISYEEFLQQTKKKEFEQDQGWQGLDDQKLYTHEEYLEFERKRQEEVQKLIAQGLLPPQPHDMHMPYGIQVPPEYYHHQQQQQQLHHPQLSPHSGQPQHPQQAYHPPPGAHDPSNQQQQFQHQQQQQQQQYHQPPPSHHQQQPPQHFNNQQPPHQYQPPPPQYQHNQNQPLVHQQNQNQPPVHQQQNQNPPPVYQQQNQNQPPVHQQQNQPTPVQQKQQFDNQPPVHQNQPPVQHNSNQQYQQQPPQPAAGQQQQFQNQASGQVNVAPASNAPPVQQQQNVGQQPPVQHNSPPLHNQQAPPVPAAVVHNSPPVHKP